MRSSALTTGMLALCLCAGCDDDDGGEVPFDAGGDAGGSVDATISRLDSSVDGSAPSHDAGPGMKHLELKFRATFTDQGELVCGQSYAHQGSTHKTITPKDFRFYVESVMLHTTTGEEVPMKFHDLASGGFQTSELALIDFTTTGGDCEGGPKGSNAVIMGTVPDRYQYDGVHVVVGVPEALNHGDPITAPAPLQAPGASWDWVAGYRFLIAEVLTQTDAGATHDGMDGGTVHMADAGTSDAGAHHGSAVPGLGFIHLGSTGCTKLGDQYRCANANRAEFELSGFDPDLDTITADLGAVFETADLSTGVQCHGAGAPCAPMFEQLGIDLASGQPSGVQKVFSVSPR